MWGMYYICERKKGHCKLNGCRVLAQTCSIEIAKIIVKNFKDLHPDHRFFIKKKFDIGDVYVKGDLVY